MASRKVSRRGFVASTAALSTAMIAARGGPYASRTAPRRSRARATRRLPRATVAETARLDIAVTEEVTT